MYLSGKSNRSGSVWMCYTYSFICRDEGGFQTWYEPISVIEYRGRLTSTGQSQGHYICDVKDVVSNSWTNDNCDPVQIQSSNVSQSGYVILFKRISS